MRLCPSAAPSSGPLPMGTETLRAHGRPGRLSFLSAGQADGTRPTSAEKDSQLLVLVLVLALVLVLVLSRYRRHPSASLPSLIGARVGSCFLLLCLFPLYCGVQAVSGWALVFQALKCLHIPLLSGS